MDKADDVEQPEVLELTCAKADSGLGVGFSEMLGAATTVADETTGSRPTRRKRRERGRTDRAASSTIRHDP